MDDYISNMLFAHIRLPKTFAPLKYDILFIPDMQQLNYTVEQTILIEVPTIIILFIIIIIISSSVPSIF